MKRDPHFHCSVFGVDWIATLQQGILSGRLPPFLQARTPATLAIKRGPSPREYFGTWSPVKCALNVSAGLSGTPHRVHQWVLRCSGARVPKVLLRLVEDELRGSNS